MKYCEAEYDTDVEASLLSWERGLKLPNATQLIKSASVAPLVGAWIEIDIMSPSSTDFLSLLSWERGLKYTT